MLNLQTEEKPSNPVPKKYEPRMNVNTFSTGDIEDSDLDVSLADIPMCKWQDGSNVKSMIPNNVTKPASLVRHAKEEGETVPAASSFSESTTVATVIDSLRRKSNGGNNGSANRAKGVSYMATHAEVMKKQSEKSDSITRTVAPKRPTAVSFSSLIQTRNQQQLVSSQPIFTQNTGSTKAVHTLKEATSRVNASNTPSRISIPTPDNSSKRKRKFPGPAGALPKLVSSRENLAKKHVILSDKCLLFAS